MLSSQFYAANWSYLKTNLQAIPEQAQELSEEIQPNEVTEKTVILDSLSLFSEQQLETNQDFKFNGGEIVKKPSSATLNAVEGISRSVEQLQQAYRDVNIGDAFTQLKSLELVNKEAKQLKVYFISDDTLEQADDQQVLSDCFNLYFNPTVSSLFSRMVSAMRLETDQFTIGSLNIKNKKQKEILLSEILFLKPALIITLGALASNEFLGTSERLKDIHGQIIDISFVDQNKNDYSFSLMPLFSPKLLQTAPNMKKMAWTDMQKAMSFLNL